MKIFFKFIAKIVIILLICNKKENFFLFVMNNAG
jgi:hypothetical protein